MPLPCCTPLCTLQKKKVFRGAYISALHLLGFLYIPLPCISDKRFHCDSRHGLLCLLVQAHRKDCCHFLILQNKPLHSLAAAQCAHKGATVLLGCMQDSLLCHLRTGFRVDAMLAVAVFHAKFQGLQQVSVGHIVVPSQFPGGPGLSCRADGW